MNIWAVPRSSKPGIAGLHGDKLKIRVSAARADGKANAEIADILEEALGVRVELLSGMTGRQKVFKVAQLSADQTAQKLELPF